MPLLKYNFLRLPFKKASLGSVEETNSYMAPCVICMRTFIVLLILWYPKR